MFPEFFSNSLGFAGLILDVVIWTSVLIFFVTTKGFFQKLKLVGLVSGFVLISNGIPHFPVAPVIIAAWLIIGDIPFYYSKWTLILLLALLIFIDLSSPFFFILGFVIYILIMASFILGAFGQLDPKPAGS